MQSNGNTSVIFLETPYGGVDSMYPYVFRKHALALGCTDQTGCEFILVIILVLKAQKLLDLDT